MQKRIKMQCQVISNFVIIVLLRLSIGLVLLISEGHSEFITISLIFYKEKNSEKFPFESFYLFFI